MLMLVLQREIGERESVAVLSSGELDGGRRATMWLSPHHPIRQDQSRSIKA